MALKDILVHMDDSKGCAARLDAALELALIHSAHVTGLYVIPSYTTPPLVEYQMGPELLKLEQDNRDRANTAKQGFLNTLEKTGLSGEWHTLKDEPLNALNQHGRHVDLIIVGQEEETGLDPVSTGLAGRLVLEVGRPVLVLPYIQTSKVIGRRVLLAWNGSREAVRAINDAIPLLIGAKEVQVLAISSPNAKRVSCSEICVHLARHDITAEVAHLDIDDLSVGDGLLSRAADTGVDLIVMGAYGHTRFRELVLGGATRHLLRHMTVPVLMSH